MEEVRFIAYFNNHFRSFAGSLTVVFMYEVMRYWSGDRWWARARSTGPVRLAEIDPNATLIGAARGQNALQATPLGRRVLRLSREIIIWLKRAISVSLSPIQLCPRNLSSLMLGQLRRLSHVNASRLGGRRARVNSPSNSAIPPTIMTIRRPTGVVVSPLCLLGI